MLKIAGVAGANHPTLNKGDAIPLSPEQKLCIVAKEQIANTSDAGFRNLPLEAKVIGQVAVTPGRSTGKKTEPAQYSGTVLVKFRRLSLSADKLYPVQEVKVQLICQDCKNEIGVADLETIDFKKL